jgi:hypothetical protein
VKTSLNSPLRYLPLASLVLAGVALATDPPLYWDQPDGAAVRQGYHIEWQRSAESGAAGEMIIAWSDTRFGMRDLFAQKVDASSPTSPAQWSSDDAEHGMVDALIVNDGPIRQEDPVLISDGDGGAIISWIDFSDDLAGDIYVNRLANGDGDGQLMWGESGVLLCDDCSNGSENMSKSHCIDGSGGAWIAWSDRRGSNWDLYISHVLADGSIDSNFGVNGRLVAGEVGDQRVMTMEHDGAGGAFIAWLDKRDAANDDIYIEHVLANGDFVNDDNGAPVAVQDGRQFSTKVTSDGGTGCFVAWVDQRSDNAGDIYVQHYNSALEASFSEGGVPIANQLNNAEKNPRLADAGDGTTLLMWEDNRNDPGNTQADIFVQKLTVGNLEMWTAGGVAATTADGNQEQARVVGDGNGGGFVVWQDYRHESWAAIYGQKIDASGSVEWDASGELVVDRADIEADAIAPALRLDNAGGLFVAWGDLSRGSLGIFTQHLNAAGARTFDDIGDDSAWGISGSCSNVKNIAVADGAMAFWVDPRNAGGPHIYMQHLDAQTGTAMLEVNGVPVDLTLDGGQLNYRAIADNAGGAYVLIEAGSDRAQQAWLTRIDASGEMIWDEAKPVTPGFNTESGLEYQERTKLIMSGDNVVVGWSGVDTDYAEFFAEVGLQAFTPDGVALWGDDGLRITATDDIHEKMDDIVAGANGSVWVLWDSGNWMDTNVLCQLVNSSGELQLDVAGLPFADGDGKQESAIACAGTDGQIIGVWLDYAAEGSNSDLIARAMNTSGAVVWTTEVDMRTASQKTPVILSDRHGGAYIAYSDFSNGENDDIYQRHLLADGSLLWNDANGDVYVAAGTQEDVAATVVPREGWNGLVVALSAEETAMDTSGYKDIFAVDSHTGPAGDIAETRYDGEVFHFFHTQREPYVSYDLGDGVYLSWVDMRASGKEDIKDIYTTRLAFTDTAVEPPHCVEQRGFQLAPCFPNPFNPTTTLSYQLVRPMEIKLSVYNLQGQLVRVLEEGLVLAGTHRVHFDARAADGRPLSSGMYVARFEAEGFQENQKMLLVK